MNKSFLVKTVLSCAMLSVMLSGCGKEKAQTNGFGDDGILTIAYAPNESTAQAADARNGLAKDLSAALGCPVKEILSTDYNAIIEALRTGKADAAYMGSQALALGVKRTNLEPIVMKAENGDKSKAVYHSVFIVNKNTNNINSIADFKGKSMAFVDPGSTSGNLIPTAVIIKTLADQKLDSEQLHTNGKFFDSVYFSGSHQAGLQAVAKGDVDIAPISDQILASEIEHNRVAKDAVKVIYTSAPIPTECFVVAEHVSKDAAKKLQDFLINYKNDAYFNDVIKLPNARFVKASMDDYKQIIELNNIINDM